MASFGDPVQLAQQQQQFHFQQQQQQTHVPPVFVGGGGVAVGAPQGGGSRNGHSSNSNSQSEESSGEEEDGGGSAAGTGQKLKRRRKRQVGTAGEGRGEWNLRTTCDGCTVSKVRCNGKKPCARCERRNEECVYSEKRRCGPKRRKQRPAGSPRVPVVITVPPTAKARSSDGDYQPVGVVRGTPSPTAVGGGAAAAVILSADEQRFLSAFLGSINSFMPIANSATLREAMLPAPMLDVSALGMGHAAPREREISRFHACKAVLLGSVALGAMYVNEPVAGARYMEEARAHLRDCFDAVIPETAACYLLLVLYHVHILDSARMFRYMGFAQQSFAELSPQVQAANCEISAAIALLSALLHVSCDSAISLDPITDAAAALNSGGRSGRGVGGSGGCGGGRGGAMEDYSSVANSRVLAALARSLVHIDNVSRGVKTTQTDESMLELLQDADASISRAQARAATGAPDAPPPPADLSIVAVKVMTGYFRLQAGLLRRADTVPRIALPVLEAVRRNPLLLNFPMGWHLTRSAKALLAHRPADAAELQAVMEPYGARLPFANKSCQSARVIYDRFVALTWADDDGGGGGAASGGNGGIVLPGAAAAAAAAGAHAAAAGVGGGGGVSVYPASMGGIAAFDYSGGGGGVGPGPQWESVAAAPAAVGGIAPGPDEFLFRQGSFDMMRHAVPTLNPMALGMHGRSGGMSGGGGGGGGGSFGGGGSAFDMSQRGMDVGAHGKSPSPHMQQSPHMPAAIPAVQPRIVPATTGGVGGGGGGGMQGSGMHQMV